MSKQWDEELQTGPNGAQGASCMATLRPTERLDCLLPSDSETGVATPEALRTYLNAMMEMVTRHAQPLALLSIAVDDCQPVRLVGSEGVSLIGRAVARCLRQETRAHDVVGRTEETDANGMPCFLIVCPLMDEAQAARLAERLHVAMSAYPTDSGRPWPTLSIGVVGMAIDLLTPDALIARAAEALHRARRMGGGRVWRHSDTLRSIIENQGYNRLDTD